MTECEKYLSTFKRTRLLFCSFHTAAHGAVSHAGQQHSRPSTAFSGEQEHTPTRRGDIPTRTQGPLEPTALKEPPSAPEAVRLENLTYFSIKSSVTPGTRLTHFCMQNLQRKERESHAEGAFSRKYNSARDAGHTGGGGGFSLPAASRFMKQTRLSAGRGGRETQTQGPRGGAQVRQERKSLPK